MRTSPRAQAGFTLLEVLVAVAILGVAVVTLIELASQSLRLVKRSGDYQQAVELADRLLRDTAPTEEQVDGGQDGAFTWERRVLAVALPEQYLPKAEPDSPQLFAVSVAVRWGGTQSLALATLLTPAAQGTTPTAAAGGIQPQAQTQAEPAPGPAVSSARRQGSGTGAQRQSR
jgi:general secretion pathway protein I